MSNSSKEKLEELLVLDVGDSLDDPRTVDKEQPVVVDEVEVLLDVALLLTLDERMASPNC